ncbi:MAG: dephospho-CoA kinase [Pseudomonadota bacterium]
MKKTIIGITGGIASGKSSFAAYLKKHGFHTLSSDEIVNTLYKKGGAGYKALTSLKIKGVVDKDGELNKKKMRDLIFGDKDIRAKVEKAIHPLVIKEIKSFIERKPDGTYISVEIPLLFEADLQKLCTHTLTVFTPRGQMTKTLKERYSITADEAEKMLGTHMDISLKMLRSDFVILNTGSLMELKKKADIFVSILKNRGLLPHKGSK